MHKDTKFCYLSFDISTFGFKAPPYWEHCDDNDSGDHDDHKKNVSNVMI